MALLRRPQDLVKVLSKLSNDNKFFFAFNMFVNMKGAIQKYLVAVDDVLPLTQEGSNLFCQVDKGYNVVLPFLEKAWAKYVKFTKMKFEKVGKTPEDFKNQIYIEKIMLGFLGSASVRLSTSHPNFKSEFDKHYYNGSYTFCYVKSTVKQGLPNSHKPLKPYLLNHMIEIDVGGKYKQRAFFMQADENGGGLSSTERLDTKHITANNPHLKLYTGNEAIDRDLFYKDEKEFLEIFDWVVICAYRNDETPRHHTVTFKPTDIDGGKFDVYNFYLGFLL